MEVCRSLCQGSETPRMFLGERGRGSLLGERGRRSLPRSPGCRAKSGRCCCQRTTQRARQSAPHVAKCGAPCRAHGARGPTCGAVCGRACHARAHVGETGPTPSPGAGVRARDSPHAFAPRAHVCPPGAAKKRPRPCNAWAPHPARQRARPAARTPSPDAALCGPAARTRSRDAPSCAPPPSFPGVPRSASKSTWNGASWRGGPGAERPSFPNLGIFLETRGAGWGRRGPPRAGRGGFGDMQIVGTRLPHF